MLTFQSDDWRYVKEFLETSLNNQRSALEQTNKTYRETIEARSQIQLLKTLLNLPNAAKLLSANQGQ